MGVKKKAVSEVVSVVLIIMITVAAIAVLWTVVIPMIKNSISSGGGCFKANADITLLNDGWTCIGSDGNVSVQIKKGADTSVNITGIQVILGYPTGSSDSEDVNVLSIGLNEKQTFSLEELYPGATKLGIAPIILEGKNPKTCDGAQEIDLPACQ